MEHLQSLCFCDRSDGAQDCPDDCQRGDAYVCADGRVFRDHHPRLDLVAQMCAPISPPTRSSICGDVCLSCGDTVQVSQCRRRRCRESSTRRLSCAHLCLVCLYGTQLQAIILGHYISEAVTDLDILLAGRSELHLLRLWVAASH